MAKHLKKTGAHLLGPSRFRDEHGRSLLMGHDEYVAVYMPGAYSTAQLNANFVEALRKVDDGRHLVIPCEPSGRPLVPVEQATAEYRIIREWWEGSVDRPPKYPDARVGAIERDDPEPRPWNGLVLSKGDIVDRTINHFLKTALTAAESGKRVCPCRLSGDPIEPLTWDDASADPEVIAAWWGRWPTAVVGIKKEQIQ